MLCGRTKVFCIIIHIHPQQKENIEKNKQKINCHIPCPSFEAYKIEEKKKILVKFKNRPRREPLT